MDISKLIDIKKDYKSAISASAFFWAISSLLVVLLKPLGIFDNYMDALPFVILISWVAGEIAERLPKFNSISYCRECGWKVMPNYPFKNIWSKWLSNNCITCGKKLSVSCENNHLLKFITLEELPEDKKDIVHCSQCGKLAQTQTFTLEELSHSIEYLSNISVKNKSLLGDFGKRISHHDSNKQLEILNMLKKISMKTVFGSTLEDSFDYIHKEVKYDRIDALTSENARKYSIKGKIDELESELRKLKSFASSKLEIPKDELNDKVKEYYENKFEKLMK
jgi:hypothetical protein